MQQPFGTNAIATAVTHWDKPTRKGLPRVATRGVEALFTKGNHKTYLPTQGWVQGLGGRLIWPGFQAAAVTIWAINHMYRKTMVS